MDHGASIISKPGKENDSEYNVISEPLQYHVYVHPVYHFPEFLLKILCTNLGNVKLEVSILISSIFLSKTLILSKTLSKCTQYRDSANN